VFIYCLEIAMPMNTTFESNFVTTIDYGKKKPGSEGEAHTGRLQGELFKVSM